jgi:regulatory protein
MPRFLPPPAVTPAALEAAALHYLERYASSVENLRRVLMRRIDRAARAGVIEREDGRARVAEVVERLRARRLVDDTAYADGRVRSLSRQGRSRAVIARTLAAKGVDSDAIDAALAALADSGETDVQAAVRFARRRRLGPFRPAKERAARRDRDLAALGRAGFSYEVARRVVDAPTSDTLGAEALARTLAAEG